MIFQIWGQWLTRQWAFTAMLVFILTVFFAPLAVWVLPFGGWNWWASNVGWNAITPLNGKSVITAVVISWFLRWLVCRRREK